MNSKDIILRRMESQGITKGHSGSSETLVGQMGCIQSQDFAQAKWAIGIREQQLTAAKIEADFDAGKILRTHVLRPTWHFVLPVDIRWMLKLTAPRIKALSKPMHRQLDIDEAILRRSKKIITKALEGGQQLTRKELATLLRKAKVNTDDIRMSFLMMDAELDGLICSGARKGKQFTYALLEERAPQALDLSGDAAIGELARRYFVSRGPATLPDFAWWSGLNLAQAKRGLEIIKKEIECAVVNGQAYWFGRERREVLTRIPPVLLLPGFDEYTIAYKDRSDVLPKEYAKRTFSGLKPVVIINGQVAGLWKRTLVKGKTTVDIMPFGDLTKTIRLAVGREMNKYTVFEENAC